MTCEQPLILVPLPAVSQLSLLQTQLVVMLQGFPALDTTQPFKAAFASVNFQSLPGKAFSKEKRMPRKLGWQPRERLHRPEENNIAQGNHCKALGSEVLLGIWGIPHGIVIYAFSYWRNSCSPIRKGITVDKRVIKVDKKIPRELVWIIYRGKSCFKKDFWQIDPDRKVCASQGLALRCVKTWQSLSVHCRSFWKTEAFPAGGVDAVVPWVSSRIFYIRITEILVLWGHFQFAFSISLMLQPTYQW